MCTIVREGERLCFLGCAYLLARGDGDWLRVQECFSLVEARAGQRCMIWYLQVWLVQDGEIAAGWAPAGMISAGTCLVQGAVPHSRKEQGVGVVLMCYSAQTPWCCQRNLGQEIS